jgi:hypothetical protein
MAAAIVYLVLMLALVGAAVSAAANRGPEPAPVVIGGQR